MPVDANFKNPNAKGRFCSGLCRRRGWGYPDVLRIRGSVLPTTIPVLFFTGLFTTQVVVLYKIFDIDVRMPESLVGTVAVVVGLLLAFRTNNAYDRYYEGRKLFVSMCTDIRNATRNIWVGVREVDEGDRQEKERNVKLLLAFAIAVKHHLRLEFGIDWYDLNDLLPEGLQLTNFDGNVAQENTVLGSGSEEDPNRHDANRPSTDLPDVRSSLRSLANRIPPSTYRTLRNNYSNDNTTIWFGASEWGNEIDASMSLPLEIIFHVGLYIDKKRNNIMDSAYGTISSNLNSLVDIFGNLERIGNTPIPFAYNVHLKQAVIIYVWILPFTLVAMLGWITIPIVVLVGFILFGVESIGAEIENPFGYDTNDLPLDGYCQDLEAEIKYLERHAPLAPTPFEAFVKVPSFLRPHNQIYCTSEWVLGNREDLVKDIIAELQPENGEEWWTYVCMGPSDPHPNWHLGMRGTQHRAVMWRVWKEGGTGFLYWGANCYEKATVASAEIKFRHGLPPGDGVLYYPGEVFSTNQPVASLRLERLLSGLQDIEYLRLYASRYGRDEATALLDRMGVYFGPERYTHEHMPIDAMRGQIFNLCR